MAKRRHNLALAPRSGPVIVLPSPRRSGRGRRVARAAGRGVRHVARHGKRELPAVSVMLGAAVVGYLQGKGFMDKLPQIGGSKVLTLGLAGYAAQRFIKNQHVRTAGIAAMAAAAFDFGRVQAGGVSGFEDVSGDAGAGPHSGQGY